MSSTSGKPLKQLQKLTRLLGWQSPLRLRQSRMNGIGVPPEDQGRVITWYEAGSADGDRNDVFLQINESPTGQTVTHLACVYAIRYRICSGWRKFRLTGSDDDLNREAARLAKWVAWDWFASPPKRRAFRQAHPECVGYSWRTIRKGGPQQHSIASADEIMKSSGSRKPLKRLQRLAHLLGWQSPLQVHQSRYGGMTVPTGVRDRLITWYRVGTATGTRNDCFLHIRESRRGQTGTYDAAVYTPRFRISTGFHRFQLFRRGEDLRREAARLAPWLAWDWFASLEKRREFRQAHPECVR